MNIPQHFIIPKPNDVNITTPQKLCTFDVILSLLGCIVAGAVKLNRKALFRTIKINDVPPDPFLTPELQAMKLPLTQILPQGTFCICGVIPQRFAEGRIEIEMIQPRHGSNANQATYAR